MSFASHSSSRFCDSATNRREAADFDVPSARLELGDAAGAASDFAALIGITPAHADAHYHRAIAMMARGDYESAVEDCRQALRLSPRHGSARRMLAELERSQRDGAALPSAADRSNRSMALGPMLGP